MLYLYYGSDREKARSEMSKAIARERKNARVVHITDVSTMADLEEALRGTGMFDEKIITVLDGVFANEEMRERVVARLSHLCDTCDIFILEEKLDAETRKKIEKYAKEVKKFEAKKEKDRGGIFTLAYALKGEDKKKLWVEYQRALSRNEAPEAIHGVLFWGAKDMFMKTRGAERERAGKLIAELAELPHEARRQGFELEYALEHYILGIGNTKHAVNKA